MPRSGTTLVEQIITSHSKVIGAGELYYFSNYGDAIARGITKIDNNILLNVRDNYLKKIEELSNGSSFVTDKMTENFKYIGLICSTIPDAKIIHVKRNSAATCWGNYKQFFSNKNLFFNYCYDLNNIVTYYNFYEDLMNFWVNQYSDKIHNLDYEKLTTNQENETKKLFRYLDLEWEEKCLAPQNNKRPVNTASNTQIRKKIYQGSSQEWKNFIPYLNGIFDHFDN